MTKIKWDDFLKIWEASELPKAIEASRFDGSFCCLTTGEVVRDLGNQVAILMTPHGGLSAALGSSYWWYYLPKQVWEAYLKFAQKKGYRRGEGPFQQMARSLPVSAGGTGRFVDMII
jgi:hypothetical protein